MMVHNDNRRLLVDWAEDFPVKASKAIIVKERCVVGDHYHLKKDERFLLLMGKAIEAKIGGEVYTNVSATKIFDVPRGVYHAFTLEAGSILLGVASEPFDPTDEVKGKPNAS